MYRARRGSPPIELLVFVVGMTTLGSEIAAARLMAPFFGASTVVILLLGAASPWAIRLKLASLEHSGQVAGRMYAISTLGSLLGTFLSALLLIPLVGTQRTFQTFALLLALIAVAGLGARWLAGAVAVGGLLAVPGGAIKTAPGERVIHETETEYQYARVVERESGERRLELNEGQGVHSVYRPNSVLTGGIWDEYLVAPFSVLTEAPIRVAILGFAAGTTARAYGRYFPETRIDGVEIDGELLEIAERHFALETRPGLRVYVDDARPFLRRSKELYDAIFMDAYRQPYVPFYLATREFFALAGDRLMPGGVVIVNVGHPETSDALERTLTATLRAVFPHVFRDPAEARNTLLIASSHRPTAARLELASASMPADLRPLARRAAARLAPGLGGGDVYTDDRAPVEWLIDMSIIRYAANEAGGR